MSPGAFERMQRRSRFGYATRAVAITAYHQHRLVGIVAHIVSQRRVRLHELIGADLPSAASSDDTSGPAFVPLHRSLSTMPDNGPPRAYRLHLL